LTVRSQGKRFTLLLWSGVLPDLPDDSADAGFGREVSVLAVFPEGSIEATDVAEVKTESGTYLSRGPSLDDEDTLTVVNAHHTLSKGFNQDFAVTDLFHLRDGRLLTIASVLTLSDISHCKDAFQETLSWRVEPDGAGPPRIVAVRTFIDAPQIAASDCERSPKTTVTRYEDIYRWDVRERRYLFKSGNSDFLNRWNKLRM
jgi:hypothetical protein